MADDYVPSRFRPTNVDRFVPILQRVLASPKEVRFKHYEIGLNPNTAISRVRDAALAVLRGKVFYPDLDADKLRNVWHLYKVDYDQLTREVVIRKYKEEAVATPIDNIFELTVRVEEPEFEEYITHLAWLYGHHKFRGFVTILGMLDEAFKERLSQEYNVYFRQTGRPNETIMS